MKLLLGMLFAVPMFAQAAPTANQQITHKTFEASVTVTPTSNVQCDGGARCAVFTNSRNVIFVRTAKNQEEVDFKRRGSFDRNGNHIKMHLDY